MTGPGRWPGARRPAAIVAILTNAGGPGVTAADALESHGLKLAVLQGSTLQILQELLPPAASVHNPVDMLAAAGPEQYATCLRHLLADPGVDSVLVILPPPPTHTAGGVARAMIPIIYTSDKPVVVALMGERMIQEAIEYFRAARVPEYRFPERAAGRLAILAQRADYLAREQDPPKRFPDVDTAAARQLLAENQPDSSGFLPQEVTDRLLAATACRSRQPGWPERRGSGRRRPGGRPPVALKVASPDILHKSDVAGVLLGLENEEAVRQGYNKIMKNTHAAQAAGRPARRLRPAHGPAQARRSSLGPCRTRSSARW